MLPKWWNHDKPYKIMDNLEGLKQLPSESVDFVCTDPPFNVGLAYDDSFNDRKPQEAYEQELHDRFVEVSRVLKTGRVFIVCIGDSALPNVLNAAINTDLKFAFFHKWIKKNSQSAVGPFSVFYKVEIFVVFTKGKADTKKFHREELAMDCLEYNCTYPGSDEPGGGFHPAQRPFRLYEQLIRAYTDKGEIVLDIYLGSGTTLLACRASDRIGLGFELLEKHAEYIERRLAAVIDEDKPKLTDF